MWNSLYPERNVVNGTKTAPQIEEQLGNRTPPEHHRKWLK